MVESFATDFLFSKAIVSETESLLYPFQTSSSNLLVRKNLFSSTVKPNYSHILEAGISLPQSSKHFVSNLSEALFPFSLKMNGRGYINLLKLKHFETFRNLPI